MKPIAEMSTADMVAEYNIRTKKNIKKFSSRKAGMKQLEAARDAAASMPAPVSTKTVEPKAPKAVSGEKSKKRAEAQRESWGDRKIAAARSKRDHVYVTGHGPFNSVAKAFIALNLPLKKHLKFRMQLKADRTATYIHDDQKYHFKIAEKE